MAIKFAKPKTRRIPNVVVDVRGNTIYIRNNDTGHEFFSEKGDPRIRKFMQFMS